MTSRFRELGAAAGNAEDAEKFMTEFFSEVGAVKASMSQIRRNIESVEDNFGHYITAVTSDQAKERSSELDRLLNETTDEFKAVDKKLRKMKDDNEKQQQLGSAEMRIRTNMHHTLTKKYLDLLTNFREVEEKYKNMHREKIERHLKIVNPDATEDDIQKAIETGSTEGIFAKQFVDQQYAEEASSALQYVQSKHKQIMRLETSIEQLHQLFVDMAVLVEAQGELIDQIEKNVQDSRSHTEQGVKKLRSAVKYQKAARKKMCCLLIYSLVVVGALVAIIVGAFN